MSNPRGEIVGIRLRLLKGQKFSVRGGREGLFIPSGIESEAEAKSILFCEGPTDTAALLDLGFCALGRPSCSGGTKHAVEFVRSRQPHQVIVVADSDEAGLQGAKLLAQILALYAPTVKLIVPPRGLKDARDWKRAGATEQEIRGMIDAAPSFPSSFVRRDRVGPK